ncbi:extended synaptotagmin-like protein [Perkinsus olseni]|uniref:Extended synaptotagmin-like protein n=1 Tax=Perkinsus olseni TaxID=32597 RepID=A0A7J6NID3_PEROL|nr:extended synaptotagmin-like protein [Perkinsus olseni]
MANKSMTSAMDKSGKLVLLEVEEAADDDVEQQEFGGLIKTFTRMSPGWVKEMAAGFQPTVKTIVDGVALARNIILWKHELSKKAFYGLLAGGVVLCFLPFWILVMAAGAGVLLANSPIKGLSIGLAKYAARPAPTGDIGLLDAMEEHHHSADYKTIVLQKQRTKTKDTTASETPPTTGRTSSPPMGGSMLMMILLLLRRARGQLGANEVYRLVNGHAVYDFWEIHEVKMYFDEDCAEESTALLSDTIESSHSAEYSLNTVIRAFDAVTATAWSSQCRQATGGCPAGTEWIGASIANDLAWIKYLSDASQAPNPQLVAVPTIRCVRVYQSPIWSRQSAIIEVEKWVGQVYMPEFRMDALSGGVWQQRPAPAGTLWRLLNAEQLADRWTVAEVHFYEDLTCDERFEITSIHTAIGSPPELQRTSGSPLLARNTIDYDTDTSWMASCSSSLPVGCPAQSAWIGQEFSTPVAEVRCVMVWQSDDYKATNGPSTAAQDMLLQRWDGDDWVTTGRIGDPSFEGGKWEHNKPAPGHLWGVRNFASVDEKWEVAELRLHAEEDCSDEAAALEGEPTATATLTSTPLWVADCSDEANPEKGCYSGQATLALSFPSSKEVKCFKILQTSNPARQATSVELVRWAGLGWEVVAFQDAIGGSTWNQRPAVAGSMWRTVHSEEAWARPSAIWNVRELSLFSDGMCSTPSVDADDWRDPPRPITSGEASEHQRSSLAFDGDVLTGWKSSHSYEHRQPAWIGIQRLGEFQVKCVKIYQSRLVEEQATMAWMQRWGGTEWTDWIALHEIGGGTWERRPALTATLWRISGRLQPQSAGEAPSEWEVKEFVMYTDVQCTEAISVRGGITPIASSVGIIPSQGVAEAARAFDGDVGTGWVGSGKLVWSDDTEGSELRAWLGLDVGIDAPHEVRCVRVFQAKELSRQASSIRVDWWGRNTTAGADSDIVNNFAAWQVMGRLSEVGGGTWSRYPAGPGTQWRLVLSDYVRDGWKIAELEMYSDPLCLPANLLKGGEPMASTGVNSPTRASDNDTTTLWAADCAPCSGNDAWTGFDFGEAQTTIVKCVRLRQSGVATEAAKSAALQRWTGVEWETTMTLEGLGGGGWQKRPALFNTMWRISYLGEGQEGQCPSLVRVRSRAWGVGRLQFYSDDDCVREITGFGEPIASSVLPPAYALDDSDMYGPVAAFEPDSNTEWAAFCGVAKAGDAAFCKPGEEWLGMDFSGTAGIRAGRSSQVDVRCIKISHASRDTAHCCDKADQVLLERWDGSSWKAAVWYHTSIGSSSNDSVNLEGRGSPASGIKAKEGSVLPVNGVFSGLHNDCLLNRYSSWPAEQRGAQAVFDDEVSGEGISLELVVIWVSNIMPWMTLLAFGCIELINNLNSREIQWLCEFPIQLQVRDAPKYALDRTEAVPSPSKYPRLSEYVARARQFAPMRLFRVLINPSGTRARQGLRLFGLTIIGFFGGGIGLWLLLAVMVGELIMALLMALAVIIRAAVSPFDPSRPQEMRQRLLVIGIPIKTDADLPDLGEVVASDTLVQAISSFVKFFFDFLLVRASLGSLNFDISIRIEALVLEIPDLFSGIRDLAEVAWRWVQAMTEAFSQFLTLAVGVPRCEGPAVVFAAVCLTIVSMVLIRWLNYDFFGLYVASKYSIKPTRPRCQKILMLSVLSGCRAVVFAAAQCMMLLFYRSLVITNPFSTKDWMCPWDDTLTMLLGRGMILVIAVGSLVLFFLCANGHFMGQDYVVAPIADWLQIDMSDLDPDGSDSVIRWDVALAMLPTSFGLWYDDWNVKAYLIKERAHVYAGKLRKSSALYLNNPPLYYKGTALPCLAGRQPPPPPEEGLDPDASRKDRICYNFSLFTRWFMRRGVLYLRRAFAILLLLLVVLLPFILTKSNLNTLANPMFALAMLLGLIKALFDALIPILLLALVAGVMAYAAKQQRVKEEEAACTSTLAAAMAAETVKRRGCQQSRRRHTTALRVFDAGLADSLRSVVSVGPRGLHHRGGGPPHRPRHLHVPRPHCQPCRLAVSISVHGDNPGVSALLQCRWRHGLNHTGWSWGAGFIEGFIASIVLITLNFIAFRIYDGIPEDSLQVLVSSFIINRHLLCNLLGVNMGYVFGSALISGP